MPADTPSTKDVVAPALDGFFGGMTMHKLGFAALAAGLFALAGAAGASDTLRLVDSDEARALDVDGGTDLHLMSRYRGGWGGYRGGYGGYRGGYWGGGY